MVESRFSQLSLSQDNGALHTEGLALCCRSQVTHIRKIMEKRLHNTLEFSQKSSWRSLNLKDCWPHCILFIFQTKPSIFLDKSLLSPILSSLGLSRGDAPAPERALIRLNHRIVAEPRRLEAMSLMSWKEKLQLSSGGWEDPQCGIRRNPLFLFRGWKLGMKHGRQTGEREWSQEEARSLVTLCDLLLEPVLEASLSSRPFGPLCY